MKLHTKNGKLKPIKKRALKKLRASVRKESIKAWDFLKNERGRGKMKVYHWTKKEGLESLAPQSIHSMDASGEYLYLSPHPTTWMWCGPLRYVAEIEGVVEYRDARRTGAEWMALDVSDIPEDFSGDAEIRVGYAVTVAGCSEHYGAYNHFYNEKEEQGEITPLDPEQGLLKGEEK